MKKIILLLLTAFMLVQFCSSQIKQQFVGYFLLKAGEKIVYYNYDEEELDDSTPVSLFSYDMRTKEKEVLLSDCIYWDCVKVNDSTIVYTDGKTIFVSELLSRQKRNIYSDFDEDRIISKLTSDNNVLYFFEINYSNSTCTLKSIFPERNFSIHTMSFSSYESSDISSAVMNNKIIFRLQGLLAFYDTKEKQIKVINSRATDFSMANNFIVYSYLTNTNQRALREYNLFSGKEKEMANPPFKLDSHNLFFRTIKGENQTYYRKDSEVYLFLDFKWQKENIDSFLIYQDEEINVFLDGERAFVVGW
ncbi:hypothetical protein LJB95_03335 [Paludibacteraceae bacterium OttesenSCG-928-F17]|nr:hypothetical protein [Paludibacteraceae bacterium OttesenSCG-928-F17]